MYYLRGLYISMKEETIRHVISCIEEADNNEIQRRLDNLQTKRKSSSLHIEKSLQNNTATAAANILETTTYFIDGENDTTKNVDSKNVEKTVVFLEQIMREMRTAIHQSIDSIVPANLAVLDSFLAAGLARAGISSKVLYSEIIDLNTNTVISSSPDEVPANRQTESVQYVYNDENNHAYRIYISPLTATVLKQMSGILISTFLILMLLSFAFYYLIRTVMRQKTLEEMKTDFVNNITHELKTPIAAVYSATETLLHFKQGENKEKRDKYLGMCIEQLSQLNGLVEQILSMSMERRKFITPNRENIEIKPLIDCIIEQHRLKSGKTVDFKVNIVPENLTVQADRIHFQNILSNLIDNAIKYSHDRVLIEFDAVRSGKINVITVRDNGFGIDAENRKHVFEKFFRASDCNIRNVKGYGLGLFYVRTMVEKHNGTISVKSSPGKGSIFTINIPA
jgi:signal transduction histidine kinase